MKVIPVAFNHMLIELEDGTVLDVNDGSQGKPGTLYIRLEKKFDDTMKQQGKIVYLNSSKPDAFSLNAEVQIMDRERKIV